MTSFAAIFDCRKTSVPGDTLAPLARVLAESVPCREEPSVIRSGGFAAALAGSAEKPALESGQRLCLGASGLNPRRLGEQVGCSSEASVGDLLFAGLERFGARWWSQVEGTFGLVLLDAGSKTLYLARDPLGERTLYFSEVRGVIRIADRLETLLAWHRQRPSLDRVQLARFFGLEAPEAGKTFFGGIREVSPGSVVELSSAGLRERRFWTPCPDRVNAAVSDADCAERFRSLLRAQTASLLDRPRSVGIMLSGGIDSTSIAAVAARQSGSGPSALAACSWTFDELASCDERPWIRQTLAEHDLQVIQVNGDACWPLVDLDLFSTLPGTPEENPYRGLKSALYSAAAEQGRCVLLNGGAADIFYRGAGLYFRDLLRAGRWRLAARCLAEQFFGTGWRPAAGAAARALRPTGMRRSRRPAPFWLAPDAREFWRESQRRAREPERGPRDVIPYLAVESRGLEIENAYAGACGVRVASPYWTRGWIDFMLSLPAHQIFRPGTTKFVAREAMRGLIPESIRRRQTPTLLDPLFDRGVFERERGVVEDLLQGGHPIWQEFVDPAFVAGVGPQSSPAHKVVLWHCVSFELWRRKHGWEVA